MTVLSVPAVSRRRVSTTPRSARVAEDTPVAVSASTASAVSTCSTMWPSRSRAASSCPAPTWCSTSPSARRSETRWCWAPSCRLRSIARRSPSISATAARREVAICSPCATAARSWRSSSISTRWAWSTAPRLSATSASSCRRSLPPATASPSTASTPTSSSRCRIGKTTDASASPASSRRHRNTRSRRPGRCAVSWTVRAPRCRADRLGQAVELGARRGGAGELGDLEQDAVRGRAAAVQQAFDEPVGTGRHREVDQRADDRADHPGDRAATARPRGPARRPRRPRPPRRRWSARGAAGRRRSAPTGGRRPGRRARAPRPRAGRTRRAGPSVPRPRRGAPSGRRA